MYQKLWLVCLALGSAVVGCANNGSPDSSLRTTPDDAAEKLRDTWSDNDKTPTAQTSSGTYEGGAFNPFGAACITIDPSTYDRSCISRADCMPIQSGMICSPGCEGACPNAAINVNGKKRYLQTIDTLPAFFCECGNEPISDVACISGVCTFCRAGCPSVPN
jgi:hypothetical protein